MTRHAMFTAVCLCVLAIGCERKDPAVVIDGPDPTTKTGAPDGMIALGNDGAAPFLRKAPVTLDEYHEFCKATKILAAYSASGKQPITGLDAEMSRQLAAWRMTRPATPTELAQARAQIGDPATRLFLVQDWLPGTQGESDARAAKDTLMKNAALTGVRREITGLRATLSDRIEDTREACDDHWLKLKPALFSLVEEQKTRDELRQTTSEKLLRTVVGIGAARLRLRTAVLTSDTDAAKVKAIQEYEDTLAMTRKVLAANLTDLAAEQKIAGARIRDITTKLERAGGIAINGVAAVQADLLARTSTPAPTRERAEADRVALNEAIAALTDVEPAIGKLTSLDDIAKELTAVKAEIALLGEKTPADPLRSKLAKQLELLTKPDTSIQRQFDQEPLLLKDIDAWGDAMARQNVLAAKLKRLQGYLADATPPAEDE